MTPYEPLVRSHNPELSILGDCFRTAIACMTDTPPALVPHVFNGEYDEPGAAMEEWLLTKSYRLSTIPMPGTFSIGELLAAMGKHNSGKFYLLSGDTGGEAHTVICLDGEIWEDFGNNDTLIPLIFPDDHRWDTGWLIESITPIMETGLYPDFERLIIPVPSWSHKHPVVPLHEMYEFLDWEIRYQIVEGDNVWKVGVPVIKQVLYPAP